MILENILSSFKFDVSTVENGYEAIDLLQAEYTNQNPYGLVLMDWMMPEMNGIETIQKIREISGIASTLTFIMITSHSREKLKEELEESDIHSILIKPINPSTLLNTIFSALGKEVVIQSRHHDKKILNEDAIRSVKNASILLVEDNLVNQEMAVEILEKAGLKVDIANNGYEAVLKVKEKTYDGVLMDCQMPVMDGFEATRTIREDPRNHALPIIAMTANAMSGDKERCIASGMNDHVAKPIDIAQLFSTMAKYIKPTPNSVEEPIEKLPQQEIPVIPELFGIDLHEALMRMNNNTKIFLKLLSRFAQTQATTILHLQEALKNEDVTTAIRDAHTLKGLAGTIGATQLMHNAATLEKCLSEQPLQSCDALLHETHLLLKRICQDIEQKCMEPELKITAKEAMPTQNTNAEILKLCAHLKQLLDNLSPNAGEFFETLLPQIQPFGQKNELLKMQEHLQNFNYDEAKAILEHIETALSS